MQNNIKYSYEIFWKIHHLLGKYSCPSLPSYMMGMPLSPPPPWGLRLMFLLQSSCQVHAILWQQVMSMKIIATILYFYLIKQVIDTGPCG